MSEYPYLLVSMKIWTGYSDNQLERMNMRVDDDNGIAMIMGKLRIRKFQHLQAMNFGRTLVVSFWNLPLVLEVEDMVEGGGTKDKWKNRNKHSIMLKVYFYGVFTFLLLFLFILFYYDYNNNQFSLSGFVLSRTRGK